MNWLEEYGADKNMELNKYKAFCQWKHFFSHISDGLGKEAHPLEECVAKNIREYEENMEKTRKII